MQHKRLVGALLTAAMVMSLCSCGGGNDNNSSENTGSLKKSESTASEKSDSNTGDEKLKEINESGEDEKLTFDISLAEKSTSFSIDKAKILGSDNYSYDGLGFISANNSSRLLLDYKAENPDAYQELLEYTFGKDGMNLSLIKIEMGADVDSSSGTEPAIMRSEDEEPDVTRGAGYQLAADALEINPDLEVDLLYWGLPSWVANAENQYEAIYKWYRSTIEGLYDTYGVKVSYLTANQNERAYDIDLIKYLRNALDNEADERYDYSTIKLVAGEEVGTWSLASKMLEDEELMDAVDVISSHYTSWTSSDVKTLQSEYGKQVWFSEGSSPMSYETSTAAYDGTGTGLSDINGMLDIATRITTAMSEGMTMYEFQPAISAYYDGVTYYPKQLITANEPWSGAYTLGAGFYMTLHFGQFIQKGWHMVDGAMYGDGTAGGDGHAVVDSTFNYVSFVDDTTDNASIVLVNNTADKIAYSIDVSTLNCADSKFYLWQSKGPDDLEDYYANFFKKLGYVTSDSGLIEIVMEPYSMLTVSTVEVTEGTYQNRTGESLALDYSDDFEYSEYDTDYLSGRGYAPRYTTDQGGAFEVEKLGDNNVLMQKITNAIMPKDWASTSDPTTNLGDDTWTNYTVSIDAHFEDNNTEEDNYVGLGARYNLADFNYSGYWLKLKADGTASLMKDSRELESTVLSDFNIDSWIKLCLTVDENVITASVDGSVIIEYTDEEKIVNSGRVAIYSGYYNNYFDNLVISAIDGKATHVTRVDNFDSQISYSEGSNIDDGNGWYFNTMCSYKNYHRTVSTAGVGSSFSFDFTGTAFALIGSALNATLEVEVDGEIVADGIVVDGDNRKASYTLYELSDENHNVKVTVYSGSFDLDVVEFQ
jgi:hypothetical protein